MAVMQPGKIAYFEGQYIASQEAKVNIMTHSFNYGTAIFEGIRGYYSPEADNVFVFRLPEHIDRLCRNCRIMCMEIHESPEELEEICLELVRRSGFREGVYIRPMCYNSELSLSPRVHDVEKSFCCYVIKLGDYVDVRKGLDIMVSSWRRSPDNALPSRVKAVGGYVNSALASSEAKLNGYDEAIFLREDGTVAEGSAMNIFMVLDGKLITPPPTADILVGITRDTAIRLAREELGIEVEERTVARTELYVCDELFFCGTGAQIAPIRSVDKRIVGNGVMGPITEELQNLYFDVVYARNKKYAHWCKPAYT